MILLHGEGVERATIWLEGCTTSLSMSDSHPLVGLALLAGFSFRQMVFLACLLAVLILVASSREARRAFWDPSRPAGDRPNTAMRPHRLLLIYAVCALVLGGSLISWVRDTEYWPFSPYPMFSVLYPQTRFTTLRLYGVTNERPMSEFPLDRNAYLQPFDNSRLSAALAIALSENRVTPALKDCLQRYEALRLSRTHQGPPIQAIRLYRVSWNMDVQANNVDNPDHEELLGEFPESVARVQ
jgi:predicted membrane protein